jgi:tetratricopeptide (TPR) repeat protein
MKRAALVVSLALLGPVLHAEDASGLRASLEALLGPDSDQVGTPAASQAYAAILAKLSAAQRDELVSAAASYAAKQRLQGAALALDLLADGLTGGGLGDAAWTHSLLVGDSPHMEGVVEVFAAVPWPSSAASLIRELADPEPLVRARAARVLAEVAPLKSAGAVVRAIAPLASDDAAVVRLALLQAMWAVETGLAPVASSVASLADDADTRVAVAAFQLAGERGLIGVLPRARALVASSKSHRDLRRQALVALARLGQADPDAEILAQLLDASWLDASERALVLWSLAVLDPAAAAPRVRAAIDADPHDPNLYLALPRLGEAGVRLLRENLSLAPRGRAIPESELYERRVYSLQALASRPSSPAMVDALYTFCMQAPADKPTSLGPNHEEYALATAAIARQHDEHARETLARLLIKRQREEHLLALVPRLADVGGPAKDRGLASQLADALAGLYTKSPELREGVARALARVDPATAHVLVGKTLQSAASPESQRVWARVLAQAGDLKPLREKTLAFDRQRTLEAGEGERRSALFLLGLDLLYAQHHADALTVFRQVLRVQPGPSAAYNCACALALRGDSDGALRWLRRTIRLGYTDAAHMQADRDFRSLRKLDRFRRLINGLELAAELDLQLADTAWPR